MNEEKPFPKQEAKNLYHVRKLKDDAKGGRVTNRIDNCSNTPVGKYVTGDDEKNEIK